MEKNVAISLLLDFYGELLKPSAAQMIDLYYNDDLSLAEIAEHTGITRQGVRDSIKRSEAQLFALENKLGLQKRFRQLEQGLDEIAAAARDIVGSTADDSVRTLAEHIERLAGQLKE